MLNAMLHGKKRGSGVEGEDLAESFAGSEDTLTATFFEQTALLESPLWRLGSDGGSSQEAWLDIRTLGRPFRGGSAPAGAPGVRWLDTAFPEQGGDDPAHLEVSPRSPEPPVRAPHQRGLLISPGAYGLRGDHVKSALEM